MQLRNQSGLGVLPILGIIIGIFVLLIVGTYFYLEYSLRPKVKDILSRELKNKTDLNLKLKDLHFSFKDFLKLKPVIIVNEADLEDKAVSIKKLKVAAKLKPLLDKHVVVQEVIIDQPEFTLYTDKNSELKVKGIDIEKVLKKLETERQREEKEQKQPQTAKNEEDESMKSYTVDSFLINNANISYIPQGYERAIDLKNLNLKVENINLAENSNKNEPILFSLNTNLFKNSSKLNYAGSVKMNSFQFTSLPTSGKLALNLQLADLPAELSKQILGDTLLAQNTSSISINSDVTGDLLAGLNSTGILNLKDITVGSDDQHKIVLDSNLPVELDLNLAKNPKVALDIAQGLIKVKNINQQAVDNGNFNFNAKADYSLDTMTLSSELTGKLENLVAENLYAAFNPLKNPPVTGNLTLKNLKVNIKPTPVDKIADNLVASADIELADGTIRALKKLEHKKDRIMRLIPFFTSKKIDKALDDHFVTATADLLYANQIITNNDINVFTGLAEVTGAGTCDLEQNINYNIAVDIPNELTIKTHITGQASKPDVDIIDAEVQKINAQELPGVLKNNLDQKTLDKATDAINNFFNGKRKLSF